MKNKIIYLRFRFNLALFLIGFHGSAIMLIGCFLSAQLADIIVSAQLADFLFLFLLHCHSLFDWTFELYLSCCVVVYTGDFSDSQDLDRI